MVISVLIIKSRPNNACLDLGDTVSSMITHMTLASGGNFLRTVGLKLIVEGASRHKIYAGNLALYSGFDAPPIPEKGRTSSSKCIHFMTYPYLRSVFSSRRAMSWPMHDALHAVSTMI